MSTDTNVITNINTKTNKDTNVIVNTKTNSNALQCTAELLTGSGQRMPANDARAAQAVCRVRVAQTQVAQAVCFIPLQG